jgi:hypothetical protein
MMTRLSPYLGYLALVLLGLQCADWIAYALWPVVSHHPFASRSIPEIRSSMRWSTADMPPPKSPSEYVIGVFGGSVASHLATAWEKDWRSIPGSVALSRAIGRPLRILDLAILSGDQPGQYNALHLVYDRIDVAVFVDGFNERYSLPINGEPGCRFMRRFWERNRKSPEEIWQHSVEQRRALRVFADSWIWWPLRYSGLFKWYLFKWGVDAAADAAQYGRTLGAGTSKRDERVAHSDERQADMWAECARLSSEYAREIHMPLHLFLQPNLHLDGTKPYSPEEEVLRKVGPDLGPYYALLDERVRELGAQGVVVRSLAQIFRSIPETLYVDACCHVNDRGSDIMAEAISRTLLEDAR